MDFSCGRLRDQTFLTLPACKTVGVGGANRFEGTPREGPFKHFCEDSRVVTTQ